MVTRTMAVSAVPPYRVACIATSISFVLNFPDPIPYYRPSSKWAKTLDIQLSISTTTTRPRSYMACS
jgi:hypothetical protein